MRMIARDVNIYWQHETLTPYQVRAASYGTRNDSGALVPEVGDIINGFHGSFGEPITVRVTQVDMIGDGIEAYQVIVSDVTA